MDALSWIASVIETDIVVNPSPVIVPSIDESRLDSALYERSRDHRPSSVFTSRHTPSDKTANVSNIPQWVERNDAGGLRCKETTFLCSGDNVDDAIRNANSQTDRTSLVALIEWNKDEVRYSRLVDATTARIIATSATSSL